MELCFSNLLDFGELINSYSLAFRLNWHTFRNQSCVSGKCKIRNRKKKDSVLINYLITLFTTISLK